jgi:hypothetical protein
MMNSFYQINYVRKSGDVFIACKIGKVRAIVRLICWHGLHSCLLNMTEVDETHLKNNK